MERPTVLKLVANVPTIRRMDFAKQTRTWAGADLRVKFAFLCGLPIIFCLDQNGGLLTLGLRHGHTMEHHYKIRPDYASGRVFAAHRVAVPSFKTLQ